ncbi:hypothetical protein [Methylomonas sp. 11b]|uniref:hypothetical protein n=1 Tax=Methylomonas sp. 11b TaxID=1168169 RepID=UPI000479DB5F|nr:hypothetical protein [Methylomonas sp. 11b]
MRLAEINNGLVVNVVVSDDVIEGFVESNTANIGDQFVGGLFMQQSPGLSQARLEKTRELRFSAQSTITGGKQCDALGAMHTYPTTKDDQAFLTARYSKAVALGVAGGPYKFMCADSNGVWARRDHSADQIIQVALAVESFITETLNRFDQRVSELNSAATLEAILAVVF